MKQEPSPTRSHSSHTNDSGFDDDGIITEQSGAAKRAVAEASLPPSDDLNLGISGNALNKKVLRPIGSTDSSSSGGAGGAAEPAVLQRPSSRGGCAFEIQYDEGQGGAARLPARLQKLSSASRKRKEDLTAEELQSKLEAAESRRKVRESKQQAARHLSTFDSTLSIIRCTRTR